MKCGQALTTGATSAPFDARNIPPPPPPPQKTQPVLKAAPETKAPSSSTDALSRNADIGFLAGLAAAVTWLIPIVGLPIAIVGLVFSTKGMASARRRRALVGVLLSVVGLALTVANGAVGVYLGYNANQGSSTPLPTTPRPSPEREAKRAEVERQQEAARKEESIRTAAEREKQAAEKRARFENRLKPSTPAEFETILSGKWKKIEPLDEVDDPFAGKVFRSDRTVV